MKKTEQESPWICRLRDLMEAQNLNPRSLSLKAGLNPTAVRDMLEGRVKFPRYDTVEALGKVLHVTPARLMSGAQDDDGSPLARADKPSLDDEDLNLLTEIISRLQETAEEYRHTLDPKDFAAMVTTLYRQIKPDGQKGKKGKELNLIPRIQSLMNYEKLRRRSS